MKNVFYINCDADPWIAIAQKLKKEHGLNPVYWGGYALMDGSDKTVPQVFPGILYCEDANSWRGRFPEEILKRAAVTSIDIDFLKQYASEELQAIKMMDRLDYDLYSFNFQERQRMYRNMVRSWMAAIQWLKPEIVIASVMPHHISDYVLYQLCKYYKIPYIFTNHTAFPGRYIVPDTLYSIGNVMADTFLEELKKDDQQLLSEIPEDILDRYNKVKEDYSKGAPVCVARENKLSKRYAHLGGLVWHFMLYFTNKGPHQPLFGKDGMLFHGVRVYYRKDREWLEESRFSLLKFCFMHITAGWKKQKLRKYYTKLTTAPDFSEPYVLYGLHYQPEATSNPGGDVFVDQRLAIDILLKNLPDNYKVYIKEHQHQFLKQRDGQTCRIKEFYDDLAQNPRIRLISLDVSTYELIQHAKAVATIMGTIGWESIVYKKPVICFGNSWYESYSGVKRVTDETSMKDLTEFIQNYQYDEHQMLAYLSALGKQTHRAYYFHHMYKDKLGISEEQCIDTLIQSILEFSEQYGKR